MSKICTVTWYGGNNFGTCLQSYALCQFLKLNNYDCDILGSCYIGKVHKDTSYYIEKLSRKYRDKKRKFKDKYCVSSEMQNIKIRYAADFRKRQEKSKKFVQDNYSVINICGHDDYLKINNDYDCFISGSDQIWNPYYFNRNHLLYFADKNKACKLSYATSIGVSEIPFYYKKLYRTLLSEYSAISVREKSAADCIQKLTGIKADVVMDPTFLLDASFWTKFSEKAEFETDTVHEKYILCYFVGSKKEYWDYVSKVQSETGYKVIVLPMEPSSYKDEYELIINTCPYEFIWLISHAEIVCTDSFHATVFSIQYHKEFYVLKRFADNSTQSQNSRLYDILSLFSLTDRLQTDTQTFKRQQDIDYDNAEKILVKERTQSQNYLLNKIRLYSGEQNGNM